MTTLAQLEEWVSGDSDTADYKFDGASLPFIDKPLGTGSAYQSGVKSLMIAVFEEGIRCFFSSKPEEHIEAESWVLSGERGYVFAFMTICDTLDLDGHAVRQALLDRRDREGFGHRRKIRTRNNVRHGSTLRPNRVRHGRGQHLRGQHLQVEAA